MSVAIAFAAGIIFQTQTTVLAQNQLVYELRTYTTAEGRLPADSLVDGVFILVAAALLVTPGILTDAFGLLCLVPAFRGVAKGLLWRRLEHAVREQRIRMEVHFGEREGGERRVYDVRSTGGSEGQGSPRLREGPRRREHRLPKRR